MPQIAFRPLAESDLADLHVWLNRPHLRAFFQKTPISEAEIDRKYGPYARRERPARCHLALLDGRVFGYLQCYRIADYPDWAVLIGEDKGIGADLAILDPGLIGKGLGKAMLGAYLRDVAFPLFPGESECFIGHERANVAGWRNSESLGFRYVRDFLEDGVETRLYVLPRG
jgi:aminoglycoside 6'-N-acetyltransferase